MKGFVTWFEEENGKGGLLNEKGERVSFSANDLVKGTKVPRRDELLEFNQVLEQGYLQARNIQRVKHPNGPDISAEANKIRSIALSDGTLYKGRVKWFNNQKGFGFISFDDRDIFVHYTVIEGDVKDLEDGDVVSFIFEVSIKGCKATKVIRDNGAAADAAQP
jgi:CspA family cold shock protein